MRRFLLAALCSLLAASASAQDSSGDLAAVSRELNNPISSVWNIVIQNNLNLNDGDISDAERASWVTNFQPVLPLPLTED